MAESLQVLIVADNLLARAGLAALLDSPPDCMIVGQTSGDDLADSIDLTQPDIIFYDMSWRLSDSLESISSITELEIPLVALIDEEADASVVMGVLSGFITYGLLLNENDPTLLHLALQTVFSGLIVIDPALSDVFTPTVPATDETITEPLTPRENDVLQLLAQGMTNKAIALQLGITNHTVKFHVNAIMTKMGAQSRTEAVVIATRAGLIIL